MDAELKPCPFCGGEASTRHDTSSDYESHWDWAAICLNEGCEAIIDCFSTETGAIKAWNTRSEQ